MSIDKLDAAQALIAIQERELAIAQNDVAQLKQSYANLQRESGAVVRELASMKEAMEWYAKEYSRSVTLQIVREHAAAILAEKEKKRAE